MTRTIRAVEQRLVYDAIGQADEAALEKLWENMAEPKLIEKVKGEWFVMLPDEKHVTKWVHVRRIRKGGDLYGRLPLADIEVPGV